MLRPCITLAALSLLATQAQAGGLDGLNLINCSALKGAPQVCLINRTDETVTDIDCETHGFFSNGSRNVGLPKGGIPAHSIVIVNMTSCKTRLVFTILGGAERKTGEVNTDEMTLIEVPAR